MVDSPADLRRLVERALADPHVVALPYRPVRELVGDEPQECHNGYGYAGGSVTTLVRDWWPCRCGGHLVLRCRASRGVRVEPVRNEGWGVQGRPLTEPP
ncbi:hypothetical protein [Micromonospora sp. ATA51]|uniref:hypothetical protein n=1 Tax=Micromonospora sp. ATA51 TaxID=2806098 RepID=UPI001A565650|nr:hypothetical protein [Micromonospora sp. ATA51]MBM0226841.1 hypothetical protein [Micromonospora sp. ATA51]